MTLTLRVVLIAAYTLSSNEVSVMLAMLPRSTCLQARHPVLMTSCCFALMPRRSGRDADPGFCSCERHCSAVDAKVRLVHHSFEGATKCLSSSKE
jgi:hypothetical protein